MSISVKLREYLDQNKIKYSLITHPAAYTAQELAHKIHISGLEIAKVVILKMDGGFTMAVTPASHQIDFDRLKKPRDLNELNLPPKKNFGIYFRIVRLELCHLLVIYMVYLSMWHSHWKKLSISYLMLAVILMLF